VIFLEPQSGSINGPFSGHPDQPVTPWAKHPLSEVPAGRYVVPLAKAAVRREGKDVTVICYGTMAHVVEAAAWGIGRRRRDHRPALADPTRIEDHDSGHEGQAAASSCRGQR